MNEDEGPLTVPFFRDGKRVCLTVQESESLPLDAALARIYAALDSREYQAAVLLGTDGHIAALFKVVDDCIEIIFRNGAGELVTYQRDLPPREN